LIEAFSPSEIPEELAAEEFDGESENDADE
jgi:hypothetical protein